MTTPIDDTAASDRATSAMPLIVLVRPQMGENIGAAARAMLNFSLSGMRIVDPRDGWPNARATAMAAGAADVLDGVRVFETVAEAVADCHYTVATTARQRGLFLPVLTPEQTADALFEKAMAGHRTAILFGAEKSGLDTDEVSMADAIVTIPVNPSFPSLNLAQAVNVVAYEWAKRAGHAPLFPSAYDGAAAPHGATEGAAQHLIEALDGVGYFYPPEKRPTLERNIRSLLHNASLTEPELRLFRGMIRQLSRKPADE